jgi:hypothetical protein
MYGNGTEETGTEPNTAVVAGRRRVIYDRKQNILARMRISILDNLPGNANN